MGGHHRPRIFLDADVLYSKTLRDWIGLLYTNPSLGEPPFDVHWSDDVMAEVLNSLRNAHPDWPGGKIARVQELIRHTFEVGRVREYDVAGSNFRGKDPGDAHVHAATTACSAGYLVTQNISDFIPAEGDGDDLTYEVITADTLLTLVHEANPGLVSRILLQQMDYRARRGEDFNPCEALRLAGCPQFAEVVLKNLQGLALAHH